MRGVFNQTLNGRERYTVPTLGWRISGEQASGWRLILIKVSLAGLARMTSQTKGTHMYKSILVAVDIGHGDIGNALLGKAIDFLDDGGKIRLIYVLEDVPPYVLAELPRETIANRRAEAADVLRKIAAGEKADVIIDVRGGHPSNSILEAAEENSCDLIMIASHRPDLRDYFIGSTAARVVRYAQCSVLISR